MTKVEGDAPIDNAIGYKLDKQVNLAQLAAELGDGVNIATSDRNDGNGTVLWVSRNASEDQVAKAVAEHEANPDWGVPQVLKDYQSVLQKLLASPEAKLTTAEKDSLLRGLALQITALMSAGGA